MNKKICLYLFLLFLFINSFAQQKIVITGKIDNPATFQQGGKFYDAPIRFYYDNLLRTEEFIEIPDATGNFRLEIPITAPTPAYFIYNEERGQMFWTPGDQLHLRFENDNLRSSLEFSGKKGVDNNQCLAELDRRFDLTGTADEANNKSYELGRTGFQQYCRNLKQQENTFAQQFINQHNTNFDFEDWIQLEISYRYANRVSQQYYRSPSPTDGYKSFAQQLKVSNEEAEMSNEYLLFIENHLRQLCLRDSENVQANLKAKRIPWPVRAYELAKQEFSGRAKDYALAIAIHRLIQAEYADTRQYYTDFQQVCRDATAKQLIAQKYKVLEDFFGAPIPSDAHLHIVNTANSLNLKQLLQKYQGKVVFLDFWASWCAPCLAEMRHAGKLHKHYENKDVAFVYLSSDQSTGSWKGNIARHQISGDHYLMDEVLNADTRNQLDIGGIPRYVLVNKRGQIVDQHAKRPSDPALTKDIERLLNE